MNITAQKAKNIQKTYLLMFLFLVLVIGIGWVFSYFFENQNILYFAIGFSLLVNIFSYWFSDKIVLKMSGAKLISRNDNQKLFDGVERLVHQAGLMMPKLYIINDASPNAFATGRNSKHSAVAVTTGLLNLLDEKELDGVIAHELSHIANKDILIATIVVVLVGFIALLSDMFIRMSFYGSLKRDNNDKAGGVVVVIGIVLAILTPFVAMLIQLAISRKREFLADASGALLTRYPEGLASALEKISQNSAPLKKVSHAMAHLYISDPYKQKNKKTNFLVKMFMTHPPVEERIKILRREF